MGRALIPMSNGTRQSNCSGQGQASPSLAGPRSNMSRPFSDSHSIQSLLLGAHPGRSWLLPRYAVPSSTRDRISDIPPSHLINRKRALTQRDIHDMPSRQLKGLQMGHHCAVLSTLISLAIGVGSETTLFSPHPFPPRLTAT